MTQADAFQLVGFLLFVAGIAAYSPAIAAIAGGALMFVAGGMAARRSANRR